MIGPLSFLHDILSSYALKVICPYADEPAGDQLQKPVAGSGGGAAASSSAGPAKRRRIESDGGLGIGAGDEPQNCPWQGSYSDLLSKHVAACPNWPVSCPRECGQTMPRRALKNHETTCAKMSVTCKICGEAMRPEDLAAHKAANVERHAALLEIKCGDLEQENEEIRGQNADLRRGQASLLNSVTLSFELSDVPLFPQVLMSQSFYLCAVGPLVVVIHRKSPQLDMPEHLACHLFHAGHIRKHEAAHGSSLAGGDVCEDQWEGTFTATLSDRKTNHQYERVTEIPVRLARGLRADHRRIMSVPFPKFDQGTSLKLKIHIQAVSIGPVIQDDGPMQIAHV